MAERERDLDRRVDEQNEQSFPASDPPSFTATCGPEGAGARGGMDEAACRRTRDAEDAERCCDPHGVKPAGSADEGEPTGAPTSDRHRSETTIHRVDPETTRRGAKE